MILSGANSAASLRSLPIRYLFLDEVDAYPHDLDGEGDPISLAEARTTTFPRRKVFLCSTPTIESLSRINREWLASDRWRYHVPCPHCGAFNPLKWECLTWPDNQPDQATYACPACRQAIPEHHKTALLAAGVWIAERPESPTPGFHLNGLYAPIGLGLTWAELAAEWESKKRDPFQQKTFINTRLGECFADPDENAPREAVFLCLPGFCRGCGCNTGSPEICPPSMSGLKPLAPSSDSVNFEKSHRRQPIMATQLVRITSEVEIPYLTYSDQPVLTLAMIDRVHNRVEGTAGRNFRANRKRFIDGEDYFYLTDSQGLDEIRRSHPSVLKDAANDITLITKSGYLMLVKSFTDDLSWQIQRQLVKLYFRVKEAVNQPDPPGFVAEELINGAQVAEIKHLVWQLGKCYHMPNGGEWAAFALVRESFGVKNTYALPARHYPEALALLQWAERLSSEFKHRVIDIERKFLKSRFKVCPPELDRLADEAPGSLLRP